jgi:hypothetical protein
MRAASLLLLSFAAARAQLFGLSDSVQLARFSADGTSVPIGPARPSDLQAQNLAALDKEGGVYYFIEYNGSAPYLVGLSLDTGAVLSSVALPFAEEAFVGVGQMLAWASDLGVAVVAGQTANQTHEVLTVNVKTGDYRLVATVTSADDDVLGAACAYV